MKRINMMAFDLGASSGRGMLGSFNGTKLELREINRFSNDPVDIAGHTYWDILRLYWEIQQGLLKFKNNGFGSLASIGIDSWGVDFGLLNKNGQLIGNPYHYRDSRTEGMIEEAFLRMSKAEIFHRTGIAFQKFNTLYQLMAMKINEPAMLDMASDLLFIPDLLCYFLTGEKRTEFTEATTSQMLDQRTKEWCTPLLNAMNIPRDILTDIDYPGTIRGKIKNDLSTMLGIEQIPFIAVATHDTGSAVASVPGEGNYAFLSSGTWSLMGVETDKPVINEKTLEWNYTNEGCVGGRNRLLKNIMGLWIIQECKREWDRRGEIYSFLELTEMAAASAPFKAFIEPDNDLFYSPGNMPAKVQKFCAETEQYIPQTKGEIVRCIYESLALKYRWSFERLEAILDKSLDVLHIVGGGSQNKLLSQFTANAIKKPVVCGPTEATAIGNIMVQALALGEVRNQQEIRQVIKNSFPLEDYQPKDSETWDTAYERFNRLI